MRYGDSAELAATIAEEGDNSPADVFFSQDPGSLGAVDDELAAVAAGDARPRRLALPRPGGHWVGTSGRTRVLAYNTNALSEDELPDSVCDLTDPALEGQGRHRPDERLVPGVRDGDAAFRRRGEDEAVAPRPGAERRQDVREEHTHRRGARDRRDRARARQPLLPLPRQGGAAEAPIANHFLAPGDPGALVSVAGAGVLASAGNEDGAEQFVDFLLSDEGQRFYTETAEEAEYPLVAGIPAKEGLPPLDSLEGPNVDLSTFGAELESTLELLRRPATCREPSLGPSSCVIAGRLSGSSGRAGKGSCRPDAWMTPSPREAHRPGGASPDRRSAGPTRTGAAWRAGRDATPAQDGGSRLESGRQAPPAPARPRRRASSSACSCCRSRTS